MRLIVEDGALDEKGASVEKLAERLGMGRRQLARLFARYLKASPSAVARTARVQRAKRLIDETDKSMMEIAVLAGFGSLRRFNAVFAEVYGRAPTKIRSSGNSSRIRHEVDTVGGNEDDRTRRIIDPKVSPSRKRIRRRRISVTQPCGRR
jgi:AraC-like DNA-binding protein